MEFPLETGVSPSEIEEGALLRQIISRLPATAFGCKHQDWRRERDSNPRYFLGTHAFQACALNHSAISPLPYYQYVMTCTQSRT